MVLHHLRFEKPDPLGAGVREEIERQRNNPDSAIDLFDRPTGEELQAYIANLKLAIGSVAVDDAYGGYATQESYELAA